MKEPKGQGLVSPETLGVQPLTPNLASSVQPQGATIPSLRINLWLDLAGWRKLLVVVSEIGTASSYQLVSSKCQLKDLHKSEQDFVVSVFFSTSNSVPQGPLSVASLGAARCLVGFLLVWFVFFRRFC